MAWREYHEFTKHTVQALRQSQHVLDWENMPDTFRHYQGVPVLDLPADPPSPKIPALELLQGGIGKTTVLDGPAFLSQLLFYSASISASKLVPSTGYRYALRVNPSSGNLHPTEFHFLTRGLKQWPDGLYHYRPSSHMAEQRAAGHVEMKPIKGSAPIVFVLTSIAWREAWKYRDRAYRYCLHDIGHAWQALALAARAMGCDSLEVADFQDDEVSRYCRLSEDEWPMLILELSGESIPVEKPETRETVWYGGQANQLSPEIVAYPRIDAIHSATKLVQNGDTNVEPALGGSGEIKLPPPATSSLTFGEVARKRRSALDFVGGALTMSLAQLSAILSATRPNLIHLYLYVHRVDGLHQGVYRYWHAGGELELIKSGDQRVAAAGLSLGQNLAGNACVAFSMIGDLERGYRRVHFEAGAIGQRLYIAAEALGLGATGIGAFFDDEVHRYLYLTAERLQVVYHFAIGYPVPDPRVVG